MGTIICLFFAKTLPNHNCYRSRQCDSVVTVINSMVTTTAKLDPMTIYTTALPMLNPQISSAEILSVPSCEISAGFDMVIASFMITTRVRETCRFQTLFRESVKFLNVWTIFGPKLVRLYSEKV